MWIETGKKKKKIKDRKQLRANAQSIPAYPCYDAKVAGRAVPTCASPPHA